MSEPCVTRIGETNGKAFVVYLRDGTKITIGRDARTKGAAWLEIKPQLNISAQSSNQSDNLKYANPNAMPQKRLSKNPPHSPARGCRE